MIESSYLTALKMIAAFIVSMVVFHKAGVINLSKSYHRFTPEELCIFKFSGKRYTQNEFNYCVERYGKSYDK